MALLFVQGINHFTSRLPQLFTRQSFHGGSINIFRGIMAVPNMDKNATRLLPTIIKPANDDRDYRGVELRNKMKVLLISDPKTDTSAAALSVAAGSMHDTKELPGLAHYCEHMLFLGTKMFPAENEYSQYLSENGGSSNAFTAHDHTCYYFDVAPEGMRGALLRFAQFFISPEFTPSMTEREVNAVNSEHEKNIPSDNWRLHQLEVSLADPNHPYHGFATGNRDTLWNIPLAKGIDVRSKLIEYYEAKYSANVMNLTILGKEDLDALQELAETLFDDVKNKDIPLPRWPQNPYGPQQIGHWVSVVPVKDLRHLRITFPIQDFSDQYKVLSDGYLAHLIGHEGPGSLLSLLKKKSLVNYLGAGAQTLSRGNAAFKVDLDLTPEGFDKVNDVVTLVFQYLKLLKSVGPKEEIWKEIVNVHKYLFQYQDKYKPQAYVSSLANELHRLPVQDVMSKGWLEAEYKPEMITSILNEMTPENCLILFCGKNVELHSPQQEQYYGISYSKSKIDASDIEKWKNCSLDDELMLPGPNVYIPENLALKERAEFREKWLPVPQIVKDDDLSRVWFLQDNEFFLPKGVLNSQILSPLADASPLNANLNSMFVSCVVDQLTEEVYAASLTDLQYLLSGLTKGIHLTVKGFDDKLSVLMGVVLEKLTNFSVDEKRFDILKETLVRSLKNMANDQPYTLAPYYIDDVLWDKRISTEQRLETEAIDGLTIENLNNYVREFMKSLKLEILIAGNFTKDDAAEIHKQFESYFKDTKPLPTVDRHREYQIPAGNHFYVRPHISAESSCVNAYFQTGMQNLEDNVLLELLNSICREPVYDTLRTKEQLGYVVGSVIRRSHCTQGLKFVVQGQRDLHPSDLDARIDNFIEEFKNYLVDMSDEQFERHVGSLAVTKGEKPKRIVERARRIWAEIVSHTYDFQREDEELAHLGKVKKEDVINFFNKYIHGDGSQRKKLSMYIVSSNVNPQPSEAGTKLMEKSSEITNIPEWKAKTILFERLEPRVPDSLQKAKL